MSGLPVGRLFVLGFEGHGVPGWVRSFQRRFGLGGVILFSRNCPDAQTVREITRSLKIPGEPPPLVMVDQEGGRVERIRDGVPGLPSAASLAALGVAEIERLAYQQGAALGALGIDVNLAPVCDVIRVGESGAIGDRSFGSGADGVALCAAAFQRGAARAGMITCAKHFPGHGASARDTHLGSGVVDLTREEMERTDLIPFKALIARGVPMVMASHLTYPAMDDRPACISPYWLNGLLRRELGFAGVAITDDMEMGAAQEAGKSVDMAAHALSAGADMLIYGKMLKPGLDVTEVAAFVDERVAKEVLEPALNRVDRLKGGS